MSISLKYQWLEFHKFIVSIHVSRLIYLRPMSTPLYAEALSYYIKQVTLCARESALLDVAQTASPTCI